MDIDTTLSDFVVFFKKKFILIIFFKVDVTTVQPISAYYSSDEDQDDDNDVLLYLPIAPEVEEPEDGWNAGVEALDDGAPSGAKRSHDQKENSSPKKKRTKSYDISLANAPSDGKLKCTFYSIIGRFIIIFYFTITKRIIWN